MSEIARLGYLGFEVSDLAAWQAFATDVLGLEAGAPTAAGALPLRMDELERRISPARGSGRRPRVRRLGGPRRALASRARGPPGGRRRRGAGGERRGRRGARGRGRCCAARTRTATRSSCSSGRASRRQPFRSSRLLSGFVTGDQGLGHLVLVTKSLRETDRFYRDLLGLRLSDRIQTRLGGVLPVEIVFLHANPRHHSLAFAEAPLPKRMHHFMLEVGSLDDVGRAYDRCLDAGVPIAQTLGRHPNDRMVSFYARTPSGFDVEFGWGARTIDDATWQARVYGEISEWGHRPPAP